VPARVGTASTVKTGQQVTTDPSEAKPAIRGDHRLWPADFASNCARDNGITFTFSEKEWTVVRKLFRRAWEMPEVRLAWDALTLEYGEL
jgi:hypothetical protein